MLTNTGGGNRKLALSYLLNLMLLGWTASVVWPGFKAGCMTLALRVLPAASDNCRKAADATRDRTEPLPELELRKYERSVFSQFGEDGVIERLLALIEPSSKYAVEFGASEGIALSNVRNLLVNRGWSGLMIEGDDQRAGRLAENYRTMPQVQTRSAYVFPGNVETLFDHAGVPKDLDVLSIDIDSNDYYVWRAIHDYRPKIVVIEYNPGYPPPSRAVVAFHPFNHWDGSDYYGASIQAMYELGREKGYELVHVESSGANLFFVDRPYFERLGIRDNSPARMYRPPQYGLTCGGRAPNGRGWPPYETFRLAPFGLKPYDVPLKVGPMTIPKVMESDR